jgi:hypothetical protein
VRLRIIYHNISVGLYTNKHFLRHCLEWILDLFFGSRVKKCQQSAVKTTGDDVVLNINDDSALQLEEAGVVP